MFPFLRWQNIECIPVPVIPVTNIIDVPTTTTATFPLTLTGTVVPSNATNQTIVWSVQDAGITGASISGNILNTTAGGTAVILATIENGIAEGTPFTKTFNITVNKATQTAPDAPTLFFVTTLTKNHTK